MNYTPEQQRAVTTTGCDIAVDAGAGSGKTRVLVDRIAGLLTNPELNMREIAAITFTEKAALEMKERLRAACRTLAPINDRDGMTFWRKRERETESARISTIHAFCTRILKENALAAGFDPDFGMLADASGELLRTESVRTALNEAFARDEAGPVAVATRFGIRQTNGMFSDLLRRSALMARMFDAFPYDDPMALTTAWIAVSQAEFDRCALSLARGTWAKGWIRRLERFAAECRNPECKRERLRVRHIELFEAIRVAGTPERVYELLHFLCEKGDGTASYKNWSDRQAFDDLGKLQESVIRDAKKHLPPPVDPEREVEAVTLACAAAETYRVAHAAYTKAKAEQNVLDFEDLISEASALLRDRPEIRRKAAEGLKYLLIDEFQDTDQTQLDLAYALMPRDGAKGAELFIVGDAKQSIYDFRGAEVEVFAKAREGCDEIIALDRNFRTVPEILGFVNAFFSESGVMEAGGIPYHPLVAHRDGAKETRVEILTPELIEGAKKEDYRSAEAALLAERIVALCGGNAGVTVADEATGAARPAGFGDVAILFRSSSNVHLYETALRAKGIPFVVVSGAGFFSRQEVNDVRNLLAAVADPWDEYALLGVLRGPFVGLTDASIAALNGQGGLARAFAQDGSLDDGAEAEHLAVARALLARLRDDAELPLAIVLRHALTHTQFEAILLAQHHGLQKAGNVRKLVDLADEFSRAGAGSLRGFVRYLDELTSRELREGDVSISGSAEGAVTIMTIHQAKGLEFPIVAVADCGRDPKAGHKRAPVAVHRRLGLAVNPPDDMGDSAKPVLWEALERAEHEQTLAEHARIFYVALTRARDWLLIGGDPMGDRDSWMGQLHDTFGVLDEAHGAVFREEGWSLVVRRQLDGATRPVARAQPDVALELDALARQAEPLRVLSAAVWTASVTDVLTALDGGTATGFGARTAPDGTNPLMRGSVVHRFFERWRPDCDWEGLIAQTVLEFPLSFTMAERLTAELRAMAEAFGLSALHDRMRTATTLEREWPFVVSVGNGFLRGTIDLIIDGAALVDFKTGAYRAGSHERYVRQLRLYAGAIHALTGVWPAEASLYYVDAQREESVDIAPSHCASLWTDVEGLFEHPETWMPRAGSSDEPLEAEGPLHDDEYFS